MRTSASHSDPKIQPRADRRGRATVLMARRQLRWWIWRLGLTLTAAGVLAVLSWPQPAHGSTAHGSAHGAAPEVGKVDKAAHGEAAKAAVKADKSDEEPVEPKGAEPQKADGHGAGDGAASKRGAAAGESVHIEDTRKARAAAPAPLPAKNQSSLSSMENLRDALNAKINEVRAAQAAADAKAAQARAAANRTRSARSTVRMVQAEPVAAGGAAMGSGSAAHATHWDYSGEFGPNAWAHMNPEYATCAKGQRQSPIDIRDGIGVDLAPIEFDYRPSGFSVADNGHTIQVNVERGNGITVMGRRYELLQFHFHRPSEERINGRQFDMVAHLVHKDAEGRLAVVAVLLQAGTSHPVIQQVWNNLPLEKGDEMRPSTQINVAELLPEQRGYYTYMGSLTTPPCTEGVLWMVLKQPSSLSGEQLKIFSRLYPMNARPLQPSSGRLIKESARGATPAAGGASGK